MGTNFSRINIEFPFLTSVVPPLQQNAVLENTAVKTPPKKRTFGSEEAGFFCLTARGVARFVVVADNQKWPRTS